VRPDESGAASDKCPFFVFRHNAVAGEAAALQFHATRQRSEKFSSVGGDFGV